MTSRRDLLKNAGAGVIGSMRLRTATQTGPDALREGRRLVRAGKLGPVVLCRVSDPSLLPAVEFMLGEQVCVTEVDPGAGGAVLLGAHATLAVNGRGCRVFAGEPE